MYIVWRKSSDAYAVWERTDCKTWEEAVTAYKIELTNTYGGSSENVIITEVKDIKIITA